MKRLLAVLLLVSTTASAQYAPQAGVSGTTAVASSSPLIKAWAADCAVTRGWLDIARPDSGFVSSGAPNDAAGAADGTLVSLGDSGVAVLTFAQPIANGAGADFAVFENGFPNPQDGEEAFLELAFVEVSSDGINYARFPTRSLTQTSVQLSSIAGLGYINARQIHNLAGKYTAGHGTPFDLAELAGAPGLNINGITHVRIIDVIGSVGAHASLDDSGSIINDPYPTFFPTGGFDLDAVAVLNTVLSVDESLLGKVQPRIFPNPSSNIVWLQAPVADSYLVTVTDAIGHTILRQHFENDLLRLDLSSAAPGLYQITLYSPNAAPWSANVYKR